MVLLHKNYIFPITMIWLQTKAEGSIMIFGKPRKKGLSNPLCAWPFWSGFRSALSGGKDGKVQVISVGCGFPKQPPPTILIIFI
jgi:hypothetical protein